MMETITHGKIIWIKYAIYVYYIQDTLVHSCEQHTCICGIPSTIKDDEHNHRTAKHSHSHTIFRTPDSNFLDKAEFPGFPVNHTNKTNLQKLVKYQLQHHHQIYEKSIYFQGYQAISLHSTPQS